MVRLVGPNRRDAGGPDTGSAEAPATGRLTALSTCHDPVGRGLVPRRNAPTAGDEPPPYVNGLTGSDHRYQRFEER